MSSKAALEPPKRRPTPPSKLPYAAEVSLRAFHGCFGSIWLAYEHTRAPNSMDIVRTQVLSYCTHGFAALAVVQHKCSHSAAVTVHLLQP